MSLPKALDATTRLAAIRALDIPAPSSAALLALPVRADAGDSSKSSADIDRGSLVAFVAGVSSAHRSDALNSTLLAAMASDKVYDRNDPTQVINWYKKYTAVLQLCGWDAQEFSFQNYSASGSSFSINSAIIEIVAAAASGPELAVVEAALDALKKLGSNDPWYKVWDQHSHSTNGGNFQIVPVGDSNGERNTLVMQCSAFAFQTTEVDTTFLWTNYHSSDVKIQYANQTMTLDEDVWDQVSAAVVAKLGDNDKTQIGNLPI